MTKCCTCSKDIKNIYRLDGKNYGYNCYRLALALKMAKLEEIKNNEYALKCFATLEVFKNKEFNREWNNNFKNSILLQWNDCKKLTGKQLNCITSKMNNIELLEIELIYALISEDDRDKLCIDIFYSCKQYFLVNFKNDKRLHEILKYTIKRMNEYRIRKNKELKTYYIVSYRDIVLEEEFNDLCSQETLDKYKNDEDLEMIEIIEL